MKTFKAGALDVQYENGYLRYIRLGETELVRMIYFALRDQDWDTIPLRITKEEIKRSEAAFDIHFTAENRQHGRPVLQWKGQISGRPDQSIDFKLSGTFLQDFNRNRAGFCILHPLRETCGQDFQVTHPDGSHTNGQFPVYIDPEQPCLDIQAFQWSTPSGASCELSFSGDVFEMEDQRNWSDASFKTYCTPLRLPFPAAQKAGDRIEQRVSFRLVSGSAHSSDQTDDTVLQITGDLSQKLPFPSLGTCMPLAAGLPHAGAEELIRELKWACLRTDLKYDSESRQDELKKVSAYQELTGIPLHLVVHNGRDHSEDIVKQLKAQSLLSALKAFSAPGSSAEELAYYREHLPGIKLGIGTPYYFTQLNRERPDASIADFVFYSNNPQVHAFDEASMVETFEGQADTVTTARQFAQGKEIWISPVSLRTRFNPDAASAAISGALSYAHPPDPRLSGLFAAGWAIGCLSALTAAGADHIDWFETEGARGLIQEGKPTPTYLFFRWLLELHDVKSFPVSTNRPLQLSALGISADEGAFLILANHTRQEQSCRTELPGSWQHYWQLDDDNVENPIYPDTVEEASAPTALFTIPPLACLGLIRMKK
jgi:hypothetical protein